MTSETGHEHFGTDQAIGSWRGTREAEIVRGGPDPIDTNLIIISGHVTPTSKTRGQLSLWYPPPEPAPPFDMNTSMY